MANSEVPDNEKRRYRNSFQFHFFIHYTNIDNSEHIYELDFVIEHIFNHIDIDVNNIYIWVGIRLDRVSLRDCLHRDIIRLCDSCLS